MAVFLKIQMEDGCGSGQNDEHLVNIKDYSQHESSDKEEEEEDSPFDDLENILAQDDNRHTRNEQQLAEKFKRLEEDCRALRRTNQYLGQRVNDLTTDLRTYQNAVEGSSIDLTAIDVLEKQLVEFKSALEEYRSKQVKVVSQKDAEIQKLREELEKANKEKAGSEEQKNLLVEANEDLIKSNQDLLLQIEKLENELAQSRSEIHSSRSYRYNPRRDNFESQVQAELEILIEKLMAELELERGQKRRLSEEAKRMQRETMLLQKEIAAKNNKIYELEMTALRSTRPSKIVPQKQEEKVRNLRAQPQPQPQPTSKSDRSQGTARTLTLMELLNSGDLQDRQRLAIASKLIDFYSRRISAKDFGCYELQGLLVCNYSKSSQNLLSIRKSSGCPPSESSQEKMLYNLGQLLDLLLGEYLSEVKEEDSGEEYLLTLIGEILSEKTVALNDIYVIKQLIEDCLKNVK